MASTDLVLVKGFPKAFPEGSDAVVTSSNYSLDLLSQCTLCSNPSGSLLLVVTQTQPVVHIRLSRSHALAACESGGAGGPLAMTTEDKTLLNNSQSNLSIQGILFIRCFPHVIMLDSALEPCVGTCLLSVGGNGFTSVELPF